MLKATTPCGSMDRRVRIKTNALVMGCLPKGRILKFEFT